MATNIRTGNNSVGVANVSSTYELEVRTPQTEENAGFAQMSSEIDAGDVTGTRTVRALETSDDFRLRVGTDTTIFNLSFEGSTIPQAHIQQNLSTMTAAMASGYLSLNSGNATASGNSANIRTYRTFSLYGTYPIYGELWIREANETATNAVSEWGFGYVSGTSAPTDGVFFRRLSGGQMRAVINFAGVETELAFDTASVPARNSVGAFAATEANHYLISIHNDEVNYWINDVLVARIACPASQPGPTSSSSLPVFARVYNSGAASAARRVEVGFINVGMGDQANNKPWSHTICGLGGGAYQAQNGSTSAILANYANSAAPSAATLSNTAASYTTLGGQWTFTVPATAAETDFALFAYTNPAGTATLPGKTLYITGIRIGEAFVSTVLSAHYHILQWGVGVASTAVSLATTDAAATVAPRKVLLGSQAFAASAAVGTAAAGFQVDFSSAPLVVPAGTFAHIIMRDISNAATATGALRGTVTVIGYFE